MEACCTNSKPIDVPPTATYRHLRPKVAVTRSSALIVPSARAVPTVPALVPTADIASEANAINALGHALHIEVQRRTLVCIDLLEFGTRIRSDLVPAIWMSTSASESADGSSTHQIADCVPTQSNAPSVFGPWYQMLTRK